MTAFRNFVTIISLVAFLLSGCCKTVCITGKDRPDKETITQQKKSAPDAITSDATVQKRVEDARGKRGAHYANRLELFIKDTPTREPGGRGWSLLVNPLLPMVSILPQNVMKWGSNTIISDTFSLVQHDLGQYRAHKTPETLASGRHQKAGRGALPER